MSKQNKWIISLAIISSFCVCQPLFAAKNAVPLDRIVATINDSVVTQTELNQEIETVKNQLMANNVPLPSNAALDKQALDQLINKKLQLDLADRLNVHATDADVNKALKSIAENNKMTLPELFEKIKQEGINLQDYRKQIRDEVTMQLVAHQAVGSKISISSEEVDRFIHSKEWQTSNDKEYHLEDILVALPDSPTSQQIADARQHANQIIDKIRHGLNFREAAAAESSESNALQGGDLGWRKLAEIPTAFANSVMTMKTDELSKPIQTSNGFHIIQLTGVRDTSTRGNATQQRQQVQQLIYQRKFEEAMQTWVTKLRSEAFINTKLEA